MRITKRQLKRIIRGVIKESLGMVSGAAGGAYDKAVQAYCDQMGMGKCEVISSDQGILNLPLHGFEDVRTTDMQDMRTQIEGISGDLVGACEDALAEYYATFDTLICVRDGQLLVCPAEAWQLLPSAIYAMGEHPDGTIRPACRFKMNAGSCENIGSLDDAMAGGMMETRRRRTRRY